MSSTSSLRNGFAVIAGGARTCARLEGWPRVHVLRPSFETLAEFIIGPRFARTRWQAPQDEVSILRGIILRSREAASRRMGSVYEVILRGSQAPAPPATTAKQSGRYKRSRIALVIPRIRQNAAPLCDTHRAGTAPRDRRRDRAVPIAIGRIPPAGRCVASADRFHYRTP